MDVSKEGNQLVEKRYKLNSSPEVRLAIKFARRRGERVPQNPTDQIQNYFDRMHEIFSPGFEDPEGRDALKTRILDRYTTKLEDIPVSYWRGQEQILRERGQMGDYNRFSDVEKEKWKKEVSLGLLKDQQASLEQWIDYFVDPDSSYMMPAVKYWVFRSVVGLSEFDADSEKFPKRSRGTLKMFPDINPEALSFVNDAVIKKFKGEVVDFGKFGDFDLTTLQKKQFQDSLDRENFADLYSWANTQISPIPEQLMPVTAGTWVKYEKGSDFKPLVASIRGKGTGWCIAADSTAEGYLSKGDFHVYYTFDQNGNPIIPRLAIRMEGNKISEVRGIARKQNVDPYMPEVISQKLEEFPDKASYLKRASDMERLTEIDNRTRAGLVLTAKDLSFLYELDSKIQGFGYEKDPRVEELISQRNAQEDMLIVFDCESTQIAHKASEVTENTKAFVGKITPGIFDIFLKYKLEHVYTSFPEGKIKFDSVDVEPKDARAYERELKDAHVIVSGNAIAMMKRPEFKTLNSPETLNLVKLSVRDLDTGEDFPTTTEVFKRAQALGLTLCPPEVGPQYRIKYTDQPLGEWLRIGMKPLADSGGDPCVFILAHYEDGLWLSGSWPGSGYGWYSDDEFVFSFGK